MASLLEVSRDEDSCEFSRLLKVGSKPTPILELISVPLLTKVLYMPKLCSFCLNESSSLDIAPPSLLIEGGYPKAKNGGASTYSILMTEFTLRRLGL